MTRVIAAFQIFGSSSAATILLSALDRSEQSLIGIVLIIFGLSICALGFFSGFGLWDRKRFGFIGSVIAQVVQIPVIYVDGLIYKIVFGMGVNVGWADSGYWFTTGWTFLADFIIRFGGGVNPHTIGVNLIPIVIIAYLYQRRRDFGSETTSNSDQR